MPGRHPKPPVGWLSVAVAAVVLAACQTATEGLDKLKTSLREADMAVIETRSGGPALPPAPLPEYGVGDAFAFDNGRVHAVAAVKDGRVSWEAGSDFVYTTERDFALPRLSWSWKREDGTSASGTAVPGSPMGALWPLKIGNRITYQSTDTYRETGAKPSSFVQWWKCWVAGTEAVEVPAGRFDTFEIICDRQHDGYWAQRIRWFYAPVAGHYVRRIMEYPYAASQRMDLVAYGPRPVSLPAEANRLRTSTVQRTLEKARSGETVSARDGGYTVAVTPLRTVRTLEGVFCRDYRQEITVRGRTSLQQGSACRDANGVWQRR